MADALAPCQRCGEPIPYLHPHNSDRGLTVTLTGGYGEFRDSMEGSIRFDLCHECGHALTDLLGLDTVGWHPEREESSVSTDVVITDARYLPPGTRVLVPARVAEEPWYKDDGGYIDRIPVFVAGKTDDQFTIVDAETVVLDKSDPYWYPPREGDVVQAPGEGFLRNYLPSHPPAISPGYWWPTSASQQGNPVLSGDELPTGSILIFRDGKVVL